MQNNPRNTLLPTPLLPSSSSSSSHSTSNTSSDTDESPRRVGKIFDYQDLNSKISRSFALQSHKSLAVLSGHSGTVSCIALCGEFILSASNGRDIIVWQQPDLRQFTRFGNGEGSVKALLTVGNRVFTGHQDSKIRVWKVSRRSENVFRLVDSMPTRKDYLGKFMKQRNYVQTRRHHKKLWIEHADSISCLAFHNGYIYSGSWDKTLKVWRATDFKCVESIEAHDDAINALITSKTTGEVYSASADGKIKAWRRQSSGVHSLVATMEGRRDVSLNSVIETSPFVYGGGSDGHVFCWRKSTHSTEPDRVCEVRAHEMAVLCMCITGGLLLSGSADKSIRIWRRESNGGLFRVGVVKGHEAPVRCLQASPASVGGGFLLYSGGLDRSLRVWWIPKYCEEEDSLSEKKNLKLC